jgi:hypothetical protein
MRQCHWPGGRGVSAPAKAAARAKRSGSQKRERSKTWQIAMTPDEYVVAQAKALASGLTRSSYGRAALLGGAGLRAKRAPPINAELLAHAVAQLNKVGSNLNQIAHTLNAGRAAGAQDSTETLVLVRAAVAQILEATGRTERP